MYNHFENTWDFEVLAPTDVENINRIHPLKQKEVISIVEKLREEEPIKRIVVFGSAVEFRCSSRSDIDLYIETDDSDYRILLPYEKLESEVDLLRDLDHGTRLFRQIEKTGIVVFEREKVNVPQSVADQIIALAKRCGIKKVILFGSRARGDHRERSDIDLAVSGGDIALFRTEIDDYVDTLLMFDVVNLDGAVQRELLELVNKDGVLIYEEV